MTTFGLFVDLRRVGSSRSHAAHVARHLNLIAEAERLGCQSIWFTEHHGVDDGYLTQPLVLAAAAAARTSRVRLGTAVTIGPLRNARHLAEEAALVDLISGGRLELGIGAGYSRAEYESFGIPMTGRWDTTDCIAVEVAQFLAEDMSLSPVQSTVPIWLGYQGPKGAFRAGRLGMGILSLDRDLLAPYLKGLQEAGKSATDAKMGGLVEIVVADDPERAAYRLMPHWVHQQNTYRSLRTHSNSGPLEMLSLTDAEIAWRQTGRLGNLQVLDPVAAVEEVRRRIGGLPAQHLYTWLSVADMPDDLVERHVQLWCEHVIPTVGNGTPGR